MDRSSDEALPLAARRDADAFGEFYRRHARPLAGYLVRRTADVEAAADLLAETFAAALTGLDRFDHALIVVVGADQMR
jgi:DNA-directed RNA polymerase specialized sigma24 family protein